MKFCEARNEIDKKLVGEIEYTLITYGVDPEKAYECYDAIRFQCEARGVLLNRVQDRKMPRENDTFYEAYLKKIAEKAGVEYDPYQPV